MLNIDPSTITDPALRAIITGLMNHIEALEERVRLQEEELQRLRDENNRLRGEQGQPVIRPNVPQRDISSETERAERPSRRQRRRARSVTITEEQRLPVDKALLPVDAIFKGYQAVVVQDIVLQPQVIRFLREKWYAPSTGSTYTAALPAGYTGQFGPRLKALAMTLYFDSGLSMPKLHALLQLAGVSISAGQVSRIVTHDLEVFHAERHAILAAGLASSPWQHIDTTETRVNGIGHHCHVLTNPLYTVYTTTRHRNRLAALDVLRDGAPRTFRLDATAELLVRLMGFPVRAAKRLRHLPRDQDLTLEELDIQIATHLPPLSKAARKWLLSALAIAAYHAQTAPLLPIVRTLVCDDAPQFHRLTETVAQCWIHDGRAYTRLEPRFERHQLLHEAFCRCYWAYYRGLRAYRVHPTPQAAAYLRQMFDQIFSSVTGYQALDERIRITREKKDELLLVLDHPELPLHNNAAELGVRRRVRKRDVSFGPRREIGRAAWDTMQSLVATAQQLGVNSYTYLYDTLCGSPTMPRLATLIAERAATAALGASWAPLEARSDRQPKHLSAWRRVGRPAPAFATGAPDDAVPLNGRPAPQPTRKPRRNATTS